MNGQNAALRITELTKSFAATKALKSVSFEANPGEVHALLGGNGSGKSTLIKVLAGVHAADSGSLEVNGNLFDGGAITPLRAREAGLRFVHQQRSTFSDLTVAENLVLGHGYETSAGRIRWKAVRQHAATVLERFSIDADPDTLLGDLSPATQTMVAIARALQDQEGSLSGVLVLDEPTASLPAVEVDLLLGALRRYADAGQTILYVTHRLDEVLELADRATVLRDGSVVDTVSCDGLTHGGLVELIMGKRIASLMDREPAPVRGSTVLEVTGLAGGPVREATLSVSTGEVVGVAGLLGSGRSSLLRLLFGEIATESGSISLGGEAVSFGSPREAMDAGVAYVPEDRPGEAGFDALSVMENMGMASVSRYFRRGRLRHRQERADAADAISAYLVKASSAKAPLSSLSGGNQQKVIMARWLRRAPRLLLLDEPTQGVDAGARLELWQLVRRAVDQGTVVLVVSSDFEELALVCDRALIIRRGRIVTEVSGADLSPSQLDHLTLSTEVPA